MRVAAICPNYAKQGFDFRFDPGWSLKHDYPEKKRLIEKAIDAGAELVVTNEFFMDALTFRLMQKSVEEEHGSYSIISGVMKIDHDYDCWNKLMVYSKGEFVVNRLKQCSSLMDDMNNIKTRKKESSENYNYPCVEIGGYRILPILCCEMQTLMYEGVQQPKPKPDLITVSAMGLFDTDEVTSPFQPNRKKRVYVDTEGLKKSVQRYQGSGFLKKDGKIIMSNPLRFGYGPVQLTIVASKDEVAVGSELLVVDV
jgi:hypothetical protein